MNPIDKLKQIKAMVFNEQPLPAPAPVAMEAKEYTLDDGTVVTIDKLEAGGVVMIGEAPAPAGEHLLADGSVITVGEGGIISAVTMPAVDEAVEPAMPEDMGAKFSTLETSFAEMRGEFDAIKSENQNLKSAFASQQEALQGLIGIVERIVGTPETTPTEQPNNFRKMGVSTKSEKVLEYSNFLNKIKAK